MNIISEKGGGGVPSDFRKVLIKILFKKDDKLSVVIIKALAWFL